MRKAILALAPAAVLLAGCAQQLAALQGAGAAVIESRRQLNDMKARAIMAATCDISVGAFYRELSATERALVALVCGGEFPAAAGAEAARP